MGVASSRLYAFPGSGYYRGNEPTPRDLYSLSFLDHNLFQLCQGSMALYLLIHSPFQRSQRCSIGFRSDDDVGHSIIVMPCWARWLVTTLAVWGLALSCCKLKFYPNPTCCVNGCGELYTNNNAFQYVAVTPFDAATHERAMCLV